MIGVTASAARTFQCYELPNEWLRLQAPAGHDNSLVRFHRRADDFGGSLGPRSCTVKLSQKGDRGAVPPLSVAEDHLVSVTTTDALVHAESLPNQTSYEVQACDAAGCGGVSAPVGLAWYKGCP